MARRLASSGLRDNVNAIAAKAAARALDASSTCDRAGEGMT